MLRIKELDFKDKLKLIFNSKGTLAYCLVMLSLVLVLIGIIKESLICIFAGVVFLMVSVTFFYLAWKEMNVVLSLLKKPRFSRAKLLIIDKAEYTSGESNIVTVYYTFKYEFIDNKERKNHSIRIKNFLHDEHLSPDKKFDKEEIILIDSLNPDSHLLFKELPLFIREKTPASGASLPKGDF